MPATIQFTKKPSGSIDAFVIPIINGKMPKSDCLDDVSHVVKTICKGDDFDSTNGSTYAFSIMDGKKIIWYVMVGVEKSAKSLDIEKIGGKLFKKLKALQVSQSVIVNDMSVDDLTALANGAYLKSYEFGKYKTKKDDKNNLKIIGLTDNKKDADQSFATRKAVSDGVFQARNFVSEPPNVLYPQSYVDMIKAYMKGSKVKVTVLDEKKLEKMGAGAILAVGKASECPPRILIMEYDGRSKKSKTDKPLAMVGKGLTYDTGGYSLKPPKSTEGMKMDMGGSAAVIGAMRALADTKADVHVVAAVALAENMIAGNGYRVDDVLTSLSGQTIEVLNTDAEGRLCLADALTYVQDKYNPRAIVDVATLTGACMMAVGLDMAGLFTNDARMTKSFVDNGDVTGDDFWSLPVNDAFDKQLESPIADMRNLGTIPYAGASTAAAFLKRFITNDRPWAHLDIAGTAWRQSETDLCDKGASGFGVRALHHWATTYK
jgi:leucyl aminopeptidase